MIIRIKSIFLYMVLSFLFCCAISCNDIISRHSKEVSNKISNHSSNLQKIKWPDSLVTYNPFNLKFFNGRVLRKSKFKLYAYLNLGCSSCIADLNRWATLTPSLKEKDVEVLLVCYAKDDFEYFKYLYESNEIKSLPFPFYFDSKFYFQKNNSFIKKFQSDQIFLTDEFDNVLLQGDIINSKEIYDSLLNKINKTL